jgi:hypothetical protein
MRRGIFFACKRDEPELRGFPRQHYTRLPRTALYYAIERFDRADREK